MLTTIGLWSWAMPRNVPASTGPDSGALFIGGGADSACASDRGARSRREASTMPMASETTAIRAA